MNRRTEKIYYGRPESSRQLMICPFLFCLLLQTNQSESISLNLGPADGPHKASILCL